MISREESGHFGDHVRVTGNMEVIAFQKSAGGKRPS